VDAVASGARNACGRMMLQWTAKSCGPDAPTLVSSRRSNPSMTVANKPGHKSTKETVKTIARGMPGVFRCDRGD
jgi:hypothetical protein